MDLPMESSMGMLSKDANGSVTSTETAGTCEGGREAEGDAGTRKGGAQRVGGRCSSQHCDTAVTPQKRRAHQRGQCAVAVNGTLCGGCHRLSRGGE